ncbi:MAG: adenosylcobinamide amidohydrolase [Pseudomonadota bacterium]
MKVLSWAINRPGLVEASKIVWRQINPDTLTESLDVNAWLDAELKARDAQDAVAFLTSRTLANVVEHRIKRPDFELHCVTTVGLGNAERVGARVNEKRETVGTINIAVATNLGLSEQARLEAMGIIVQARTTAVLEQRLSLPTGYATGTGTDCVAIASPDGDTLYTGMHTEFGEALGRVVLNCVAEGAREWRAQKSAEQL